MPGWIVQYVYVGASGKTRMLVSRVEADTAAEARTLAAETAPAEEFVITVQPESDEQVLGTVKHQAGMMSGKGIHGNDLLDDDA